MDGAHRALSGTVIHNGGIMFEFLCVFQGSIGAEPSREAEGSAAVRVLGATGEPAGEAVI